MKNEGLLVYLLQILYRFIVRLNTFLFLFLCKIKIKIRIGAYTRCLYETKDNRRDMSYNKEWKFVQVM